MKMRRSHVARMEEMRNAYKILVGNSEGRYHLGNLCVDGCMILICILKFTGCEDVNSKHLAQYRFHWRALMNPVMNLGVPLKGLGLSGFDERLLASQEASLWN
jgi:hypothetical protein